MENIQINGQKIWGPPKNWLGPPPPHGTEVFIKNIPEDVSEIELYKLFSAVGRIYEVRLPVYWSGRNKGYAFVRFTKVLEADEAIEKLNHCMIRQGRQIRVERSLDNTRLFLSSVPNDKTGDEIKSDLLSVVENVKTVYVYPDLENSGMFRGYAFVEFVCHRDAAIAKRILTPDVLFKLFEKKCIAAWANPLPFLNKETLKNINILFMRNIPSNTKSISIKMIVDSLIYPNSLHKIKRLHDYAFLTFKNHEMAESALIKIKCNPFLLGPKPIHVEWAIPREVANLFSSKSLTADKDVESKKDFNIEDCEIHSTLQDGYLNPSDFIIDEFIKVNGMNKADFENDAFVSFSNVHAKPNCINSRTLKKCSESSSAFYKTQNSATIYNTQPNVHNNMSQNNSSILRKSAVMSDISNLQNTNASQNQITEFRNFESENCCRDAHLKNWLQSLTLNDYYSSSIPSPTLTSPSTGSSTNSSWKWDEGCSQFSNGSGLSLCYDVNTCKTKSNSDAFEEFLLY